MILPWLFGYVDGVVGDLNAEEFERGLKLVGAGGERFKIHQHLLADRSMLLAGSR